jgi:Leucine-rich repeat (LRR) protein
VVQRLNTAKEEQDGTLDLSQCQLTQLPDAVFLLMKNVSLSSCNLSGNLIQKIPAKLAINFCLIKELDLSNNRISMLPGEMTNCTQLESIDISSNSFVTLPPVLAEMPSIKKIIARKNYMAELDVEVVASLGNLATLNLEENPLNKTTYEDLERLTSLQILLSPRTMEEWEDLSI